MDAPVPLTGATGYIGGRLLRRFEEVGRPVRCLARNPERVQAAIVAGAGSLSFQVIELAVRSKGVTRR